MGSAVGMLGVIEAVAGDAEKGLGGEMSFTDEEDINVVRDKEGVLVMRAVRRFNIVSIRWRRVASMDSRRERSEGEEERGAGGGAGVDCGGGGWEEPTAWA
ncbi:UNVERIFIED_CONTAM: hypothetical protein PYX00_000092 [Menopon gallinae]|uniref:Uncharacterized protein n=1 Tax=Menopon gallinae TaxID=328185 RepID=A0AAW2I7Y5_9NEOP